MITRYLKTSALTTLLFSLAWPVAAKLEDDGQVRANRAASSRPTTSSAHRKAGSVQSDSSADARASSEGGIGVGSQGQSMSVDSHSRAAASTAIGPALAGSNDTCMGSASVGAAGMAFGLSLGTTYTDDNCMMLKNARELWNMGYRGAAIARMCMDVRNRQALEASGVPCPPLGAEKKQVAQPNERESQQNALRNAVSTTAESERFIK